MKNKYPVLVYGKFFFEHKNSYSVLAYIADRCNYKCEYCYNHQPRSNVLVDLNKLYNFIETISKQKDYILLDLIGGETTLHPDLYDFCLKAKNEIKTIELTIYTNFSQPFEYYRKFTDIGVHFIVSWHSQCNTEEFINKLKMFTEKERKLITVAVMYEHNNILKSLYAFDEIKKLPEFKELQFSYLEMSENYSGYKYTEEQLKEFDKRKTYTKTQPTIIKFNDGSIKEVNDNYFFFDHNNTNFKYWKCNAGKDFVYVHWNGDVHTCDEYDGNVIYNINTSSTPFEIPTKPILCKYKNCPCLFDIYKERVLGVKH